MVYQFEKTVQAPFMEGHLKAGGANTKMKIGVSNKYFTMNDKPWIPIMGECHYCRIPKEDWEKEILKMKAGGISVIATYVFWIYHEEIEGKYEFSGNRDLHHFIELCNKHGMLVCLRIGPWAHGEVRNGGFPDWLLKKLYKLRCNDTAYLQEVKRFYEVIYEEVKDFLFFNDGNIVAIQLENELTHGADHLLQLKKMAWEIGLRAPLYTVTGWNSVTGAQIPETEVVPVFGGYPEAPWEQHTKKLPPNSHYFFLPERNDSSIGNDLQAKMLGKDEDYQMKYDWYPYATCELGGGIQVTHKRRPHILPDDVASISMVKLGCGNNLPGYYMYHGGKNDLGECSTLQESKKTGYPNDYTILNYDFQAPLGLNGEVRDQYRKFKMIHQFIQMTSEKLGTMAPYFQKQKIEKREDKESLRYSMRHNGKSGYVFVNNYQRLDHLAVHHNVQFEVELADRKMVFPKEGITVEDGAYFILPFNLEVEGFTLQYATAQLLTKHKDTVIFFAPKGVRIEYAISASWLSGLQGEVVVEAEDLSENQTEKMLYIRPKYIGKEHKLTLTKKDGKSLSIVTLTSEEAEHLYELEGEIYIGKGDLYQNQNRLFSYHMGQNDLSFWKWDGEVFKKYTYLAEEKKEAIRFEQIPLKSMDEDFDERLYLEDMGKKDYKHYRVEIDLRMLRGVEEAFLEVSYVGDGLQAYIDRELVMDQFYYGDTCLLSIRQLLKKGKEIDLYVTPLERSDVYLEAEAMEGCKIEQIHYVPLYQNEVMV